MSAIPFYCCFRHCNYINLISEETAVLSLARKLTLSNFIPCVEFGHYNTEVSPDLYTLSLGQILHTSSSLATSFPKLSTCLISMLLMAMIELSIWEVKFSSKLLSVSEICEVRSIFRLFSELQIFSDNICMDLFSEFAIIFLGSS